MSEGLEENEGSVNEFYAHSCNTNEDSLSECRHPVAGAILEYRKWKKLKEDVGSRIHEIRPDGRIHGQFNPLGTDTGWFSSSEPNMQNITRGELRTAFVASVGNVLVIADYSQIELRAAAYFSGDKRMIEAFIKGEDLHTKTASIVLGKSEKEITNEDRQLAKRLTSDFCTVNLQRGLFGMSR